MRDVVCVNVHCNPRALPPVYVLHAYTLVESMTQDRHRPERFLPLPPAWLDILLALCADDLHGYAVMQEVARAADTPLHPGTLYRALARLLESELIVELDTRPSEGDDERRRYYRISDFGRLVARAEAERLQALVQLARTCGLAPRSA